MAASRILLDRRIESNRLQAFDCPHSPFFKMPQDSGVRCHNETITTAYRAFEWNLFGMDFSQGDIDGANKDSVDAHMAVPNRSCMKAYRGGPPTDVDVFSGMCKAPNPP